MHSYTNLCNAFSWARAIRCFISHIHEFHVPEVLSQIENAFLEQFLVHVLAQYHTSSLAQQPHRKYRFLWIKHSSLLTSYQYPYDLGQAKPL